MEKEIWRDVQGYEGLYQVSNLGRVKSLDRVDSANRCRKGRIMNLQNNKGYMMIRLSKNNIRGCSSVHRLVALAFINNPQCKPEINHIDGNKGNNNVENLEWVTSSENQIHAFKIGLQNKTDYKNDKKSKPVIQIKNGDVIKEFPSAMEVERITGFPQGNISNCCRGRQKTAYGYKWQYKY